MLIHTHVYTCVSAYMLNMIISISNDCSHWGNPYDVICVHMHMHAGTCVCRGTPTHPQPNQFTHPSLKGGPPNQ